MSDLHLVAMPKWGLSMEEGVVVAWHKDVSEAVARGDDLADVETTKIANTVEAPVDGHLLRLLAAPGTTIACGAALAVIGPADTPAAQIDRYVADHAARAEGATGADAAPPPEAVTRTVDRNGEAIRLRYLDTGAGAETIVLIHGFGGDLENWMFNQPVLAAAMRVIAVDLPGHGGSDKRVGDGAAAMLADTVVALLDEIAPGRVHLVGHSFGAMVARHIASAHPDRVVSVCAIAPADLGTVARAYVDGFVGARRRSELSAALGMLFADPALVTRDMAETLLRYKRLDGVDHALRAIDAANLATQGPAPDALAFWRSLGSRGLILRGAQDAVVPIATAATDFPGVAQRVIDGAGHMPHLERPDAVNSAIIGHAADNPAHRPSGPGE